MNVITITGTGHYHGQEFITPGMKIRLIKDPDNEYDREAIRTYAVTTFAADKIGRQIYEQYEKVVGKR